MNCPLCSPVSFICGLVVIWRSSLCVSDAATVCVGVCGWCGGGWARSYARAAASSRV